MLEEKISIIELMDTYGMLLTDTMLEIMNQYFINDISLAEIAENKGISRQAVHDSISKSIKKLKNYEKKLKIIDKSKRIKYLSKLLLKQGKLQKRDYNKILKILEE